MSDLSAEIQRTLETLYEKDALLEMRVLVPGTKTTKTGRVYTKSRDVIVNEVLRLENDNSTPYQYYTVLNEISPKLEDRITDSVLWGRETTKGPDITRRRYLPVDTDPDITKDTSASDEEKELTKKVAYRVRDYLTAVHGFPDAIIGDSGNGYWPIYRVDMANDAHTRELHRKLIQHIDKAVEHTGVKFDSLIDPNRIVKLFGTVARKGQALPDRPHRQSRIEHIPDPVEVLTLETLTALVGDVTIADRPKPTDVASDEMFDVREWLDERNHEYKKKEDIEGTKYILDVCPFNSEHARGEAYVMQFHANGAVVFNCLHDTCRGVPGDKAWQAFRAMEEPEYAECIERFSAAQTNEHSAKTINRPKIDIELTRGDRLLLKFAKKSKDEEGEKTFKFLYDETNFPGSTARDKLNQLVTELAYWCNGDIDRMRRLLLDSTRMKEFQEETTGLNRWIELQASAVVDGDVDGFLNADVIEFMVDGNVNPTYLADEIVKNHKLVTLRDTREVYRLSDEHLYEEHGDQTVQTAVQELAKHKSNRSLFLDVLSEVQGRTYTDRTAFEPPINLIPGLNGVFDLSTNQYREYLSNDYFFHKHKGDYDLAILKDKNNPGRKFIYSTFTKQQIPLIQEIVGLCLYRKMMTMLKYAFMFIGNKDSGKTTFFDFVKAMLGPEAVSTATLHDIIKDRFATSDMYQKNSNMQPDISNETITKTGEFKALNGGDGVTAQKKNGQRFTLVNYATMMFGCNLGSLPEIKVVDDVFYERWVLIEMPYIFVNKKPSKTAQERRKNGTFGEKIDTFDAKSWLFTWGIEGLKRLLRREELSETASNMQVKERWQYKTDHAGNFFDNKIEVAPGITVYKKDVYASYIGDCIDLKIDENKRLSYRKFNDRLKTRYEIGEKHAKKGAVWIGIALKGAPPQSDEDDSFEQPPTGPAHFMGKGEDDW